MTQYLGQRQPGTISPREEGQMTTRERTAILLILLGVAGLTMGAGYEWGWPAALMVLGAFLVAAGIFMGLVSDGAE